MKRTGKLQINGNESRLDDGTLLASCDDADPIGAGTAFLKNKGLRDGDDIWVTGNDGNLGNVDAFCMDDAGPQMPPSMSADKEISKDKIALKKSFKPRRRKKSRSRANHRRKGK
jgi:hypothetical protein